MAPPASRPSGGHALPKTALALAVLVAAPVLAVPWGLPPADWALTMGQSPSTGSDLVGAVLLHAQHESAAARDAATGAPLWTTRFGGRLAAEGGLAVLAMPEATRAVSVATGGVAWVARGAEHVAASGGVVATSGWSNPHQADALVARNASDGAQRWLVPGIEAPPLVTPDGGLVLTVEGTCGSMCDPVVVARDGATGALRWTAAPPAPAFRHRWIAGDLVVDDGRAFLGLVDQRTRFFDWTGAGYLVLALDLATGARLWTAPLAPGLDTADAGMRLAAAHGRVVAAGAARDLPPVEDLDEELGLYVGPDDPLVREDAFVAALDAGTGALAWVVEPAEGHHLVATTLPAVDAAPGGAFLVSLGSRARTSDAVVLVLDGGTGALVGAARYDANREETARRALASPDGRVLVVGDAYLTTGWGALYASFG